MMIHKGNHIIKPCLRLVWLWEAYIPVIEFPKFSLQGSIDPYDDPDDADPAIPGLVVRGDGFQLGRAEICYGCPSANSNITTDDTSVKFGSMLEFDDIRIGVENFGITYGSALQFTGNIYVASGGATLFPDGPVSATITDSNRATDVDSSTGLPDDEAIRLGISFDDNGQVEGFQFDIDTMEVSIADVVTLRTQDFVLDTTASSNEELVSFTSVSATVEIGSLMLTGEGRNFAFMGDGSFMAKEGFGVFLSVGSATGESFKWPSWLPVKIHSIGIEWDDFNADSSDFNLVLSLSISSMPSAPGLKFSGTIEGVKIKPSLLLEG